MGGQSARPPGDDLVAGGRYIVVGTGETGAALDREIQEAGGRVICYVEDNPKRPWSQWMGKPVLPLAALQHWRPLVDRLVVADTANPATGRRLAAMGYTYPGDLVRPFEFPAGDEASAGPVPPLPESGPGAPYQCPVCMMPVAAWLPFTRRVADHTWRQEPGGRLCPHCGSFERTRHFWLFLEQRGLLQGRPRFLHVAPEIGLSARLRAELGERYVTVDLSMPHVDRRADLTALPFADEAFDFVYCSNVLEHVPDDRSAMRELARVLSADGAAYVQVPTQGAVTQEDLSITDPAVRTTLYGQADHVRLYGSDIVERLRAAGLEVEALAMPDALALPAREQDRFNCAKRERVHWCRKARA